MEGLNYDTIHGYRNNHRTLKEGHPFERLNDHEYLRSIGASAVSEEDGKLHPTAAGMLMSGNACDFYFRVYNKIIKDIKVPFKMVGGERVDDTPVHKAFREALANCLINIGERAGSGVPNIFNVWNDEGFVEPEIEERFDPDRTILTLSFAKKATKKRQEQYEKILTFMQSDVWYKASDLMHVLGVKETRTKESR